MFRDGKRRSGKGADCTALLARGGRAHELRMRSVLGRQLTQLPSHSSYNHNTSTMSAPTSKQAEGYSVEPEATQAGTPAGPNVDLDPSEETKREAVKLNPDINSASEVPSSEPHALLDEISAVPITPVVNQSSEAGEEEDHSPLGILKGMFPEMEVDTLEAVLGANQGSVETAIEQLLAMSDPTSAPPPTSNDVSPCTQSIPLHPSWLTSLFSAEHLQEPNGDR